MNFDESRVYTAINAEELEEGDIVCVADSLSDLRDNVKEEVLYFIERVLDENEQYRFRVGPAHKFALAYLVCPKRNAKAFWAYRNNEAIEVQAMHNGGWWTVKPETELGQNFWFAYAIRVKKSNEEVYRQFKNVKELIAWYKHDVGDEEEGTLPLIWVKKKCTDEKFLITGFVSTEDGEFVAIGTSLYSLGVLFEKYTFLNGAPCGVNKDD